MVGRLRLDVRLRAERGVNHAHRISLGALVVAAETQRGQVTVVDLAFLLQELHFPERLTLLLICLPSNGEARREHLCLFCCDRLGLSHVELNLLLDLRGRVLVSPADSGDVLKTLLTFQQLFLPVQHLLKLTALHGLYENQFLLVTCLLHPTDFFLAQLPLCLLDLLLVHLFGDGLPSLLLDAQLFFLLELRLPDLGLPHDLQGVLFLLLLDVLGILKRFLHGDALGLGLMLCQIEAKLTGPLEFETPVRGDNLTLGESAPRFRED